MELVPEPRQIAYENHQTSADREQVALNTFLVQQNALLQPITLKEQPISEPPIFGYTLY